MQHLACFNALVDTERAASGCFSTRGQGSSSRDSERSTEDCEIGVRTKTQVE